MNSVTFGDKNSFDDWGLSLRPKSRPKPTPRYNRVIVPGRDGSLDLTEALGDVFYEDLEYSLEFNVTDAINTWDSKLREITNYLHGKKMKVVFSDDPDYYYMGRVKINDLSSNRNLGILSLSCTFEPYKYKKDVTVVTHQVTAGNSYTFTNGRKKVVPTLTLSADMTLTFKNASYSLTAGTQKVLAIQFEEGENIITIATGSGTLKAEYQECDL